MDAGEITIAEFYNILPERVFINTSKLFIFSIFILSGKIIYCSWQDTIWIAQSGAMVFILNLDNVSLKKLFPTMNI